MRSNIFQEVLNSTPADVDIFVRWYGDIVVRIHELLMEKGINKKTLAEKLEKRPSEISKWLGGEHNFTLRSLAKLSAELGESILEVPKRTTQLSFIEGQRGRKHTFIVYKKFIPKRELEIIQCQPVNEINFLSDVG